MKIRFASLGSAHSGSLRSLALLAGLAMATGMLGGCKSLDEPGAHVAGYTLIEPQQRHPIMVSQEPASMTLNVAAGSPGLSPGQRAQISEFLNRYRAGDAGNSKLLIAVPSGGANEVAAMRAVGQLNGLIKEAGFAENAVQVRAYHSERHVSAPIRFAYMRYVAQAPHCGTWPENLAREDRNLNYYNFGCAQQANLAAMIANPADLVTPRTMDPAEAERKSVIIDKYRQGRPTASEKGADDTSSVKSGN